LAEQGIGTEVYYPRPLHMQECFKDLGYEPGDFPESEIAANEALAIPVYPELDANAQSYVVDEITSFYRKAAV
jgi:dTDP-4-amino-4,6-dideoxygalactose transaminase